MARQSCSAASNAGGALLEQRVGEQQQALRVALVVAGGEGGDDDLPGDPRPRPAGAWGPQHVVASQQAGAQGRWITGAAAQFERAFAERSGAGSVLGDRMLELSGQRRGELGFARWVGAGDDREGLVELGHDLVPGGSEAGPELGRGQRHLGSPAGVAGAISDVSGRAQQAPGVQGASGAGQGVGLGHEHVDELVVRDVDGGFGDGGAQPAEVGGGFPEGQRRAVGGRGL